MALVVFRSKAAGEIFMFAETARRIFEIIGKAEAPRGVITVEQVPDALARLSAAVEQEKAQLRDAAQQRHEADRRGAAAEADEATGARAVTLGQRAFPLLEMLEAARRKQVEVTWGI